MKYYDVLDTPFGKMTPVVDSDGCLEILYFGEAHPPGAARRAESVNHVAQQLTEYFSGNRRTFDLELKAQGTPFQHEVWQMLQNIPYGETRSYGELSTQMGRPGASRAVGRANATNPIAIIVPCHRVIGSNGTLTGYAGGLAMKERLLAFEQGRSATLFD